MYYTQWRMVMDAPDGRRLISTIDPAGLEGWRLDIWIPVRDDQGGAIRIGHRIGQDRAELMVAAEQLAADMMDNQQIWRRA